MNNEKARSNLIHAMMFLEISGEEGLAEKYGLDRSDCIWAARSYIQEIENGNPVADHAKELLAKIQADTAIEEMMERSSGKLKIISAEELLEFKPPERHFAITNKHLTLKFGGYDYDIEWSRIKTHMDLISWLHHICEKEWELLDPWQIHLLIESVSGKLGWKLYK